ncbi:MAG: transglycosylase domain-containing protein [Balneolaceae bacterium]
MKYDFPPSLKRVLSAGALISASLILMLALFLLSVWAGLFGSLPASQELQEIRNQEATQILASDGSVIGSIYHQNRITIPLEEVSPNFKNALLATEDIRFYQHNGIDYRALARVLIKTILFRQDAGGGSTLTQQLAKNLYPRESGRGLGLVIEKTREMMIARRLESVYTKDEILELYINTVSFGENTYGLERAAKHFYNKHPDKLELHEAATLAGVLRATTWYNPRRNPGRALQRRNLVLSQMEKYGLIQPEERRIAAEKPLGTVNNQLAENHRFAPYFQEQVKRKAEQILDSLEIKSGRNYDIYSDGLVIETTLNPTLQRAAEQAVASHLKQLQELLDRQREKDPFFGDEDETVLQLWRTTEHYRSLVSDGLPAPAIRQILYEPVPTHLFTWNGPEVREVSPYDSLKHYLSFLNAGFLAMDPGTGDILAWSGGINHPDFQFDHVSARRQTGSAFKPIVYATALEQGYQPCSYYRNQLTMYTDFEEWTPRNVNDEYGGYYSLQGALSQSVNTVTIDLMMETGIDPVRQMSEAMGIRSSLPDTPSLALGTAEASLLELAGSYALFANRGYRVEPRFIRAIYDADGDELYRSGSEPRPDTRVLSEENAATMVRMLSAAVDRGTGQPLRSQFGIQGALAGKTGTTQHYTDGWFIGITPEMVFGTWVGGPVSRVRFQDENGYASRTALPIAGLILQKVQTNTSVDSLFSPEFYPYQWETNHDLSCPDYREERFLDRARDFFSGRDPESPRKIGADREETKSLLDRLRGIFTRD